MSKGRRYNLAWFIISSLVSVGMVFGSIYFANDRSYFMMVICIIVAVVFIVASFIFLSDAIKYNETTEKEKQKKYEEDKFDKIKTFGKSLNTDLERISFEDNMYFILKNFSDDTNLIYKKINEIKKIIIAGTEIAPMDDDTLCKAICGSFFGFGIIGTSSKTLARFALELYRECKVNPYFNIEDDESFIKLKNNIIK